MAVADKIKWKSSKGLLTGTVETVKHGEVTVSVEKSSMCYTARFMKNTVIYRVGYKEEAKQLCIDFLEDMNLVLVE